MKIQHPFQCIEATRVCTPDGECHSVLLAASGPTIRCFDIQSGKLCSSWGSGVETAQENAHDIADNDGEPPGKKLRLSEPEDDGNATVSKKGKKNGDQAKAEGAAVIILQVIPGSQRFVAVTGEDKAVRVFELDGHGTIKPLSIRYMPKRPCMIRITPDGKTILSGDKFGDVFSLPLIPTSDYAFKKKKYEFEGPAATTLTVHSKRNRDALKNQEIQKKLNPQTGKDTPDFEHHLLIGHVSMLTNLLYVEAPVDGVNRPYIITSDRDEHIRVSRGPPQTHVIESYCLGHTEFISQIHVPPNYPHLLASAGGDGELRLWHWQDGKLLDKADLGVCLFGECEEKSQRQVPAVRGMWSVGWRLFVAFEGHNEITPFEIEGDALKPSSKITLAGNFLDATIRPGTSSVIISLDIAHQAASTVSLRSESRGSFFVEEVIVPVEDLQKSKVAQELPQTSSSLSDITASIEVDANDEKTIKKMRDLLYNLENLRKKSYEGKEPADS